MDYISFKTNIVHFYVHKTTVIILTFISLYINIEICMLNKERNIFILK
jgi:hypothetical protein